MSAVPIMISGVLWDDALKSGRKVHVMGQATIMGLSVGGGPIVPPDTTPPDPGSPPSIWPNPPEGQAPIPSHPIALPGDPWWPGTPPGGGGGTPPTVTPPNPGDPTTPVPGNWPVQPITPPPYIVVNYPGIGPVVVAPPVQAATTPEPAPAPEA